MSKNLQGMRKKKIKPCKFAHVNKNKNQHTVRLLFKIWRPVRPKTFPIPISHHYKLAGI